MGVGIGGLGFLKCDIFQLSF